jgi:hypothetical protein
MIWLLPLPLLPLSCQQVVSFSQSSCVWRSSLLIVDGEGLGKEPNQTTARKFGPLYNMKYSLGQWVGLCEVTRARADIQRRGSIIGMDRNFVCLWRRHMQKSSYLSIPFCADLIIGFSNNSNLDAT